MYILRRRTNIISMDRFSYILILSTIKASIDFGMNVLCIHPHLKILVVECHEQALIMKHAWAMMTSSVSLWVQVLKITVWNEIREGIHWVVRNGHEVNFWEDRWLPSVRLVIDVAVYEIPEELMKILTDDVVNQSPVDFKVLQGYIQEKSSWRFMLNLLLRRLITKDVLGKWKKMQEKTENEWAQEIVANTILIH
ncbi:hypothetical protein VNO78_10100 [Psophocarpus tetragonolobus]|uniref:Uncharacterized protein n=1 Tax=Psophocarpus tetragonolobus TaxID=3891 RepID=A0AAN9SK39_PSOTE